MNVGLGGSKDKETMYSVLQLSSSPMIGIQRRTNVFNIKSYNIVQYSDIYHGTVLCNSVLQINDFLSIPKKLSVQCSVQVMCGPWSECHNET